jgi:hypothetical protein
LVNVTLSASGGDGGYTFSSSDLPSGLILSSDGTLTGTLTATATKTLTFSVTVTDSAGETTTGTVSLVDTIEPLALTSTSLDASNNAVNTKLTASGGDGQYSFSSSDLPSGLTLSSDGTLTGTLNEIATTTLTFSVTVTDSTGDTATGTVSLVDNIVIPIQQASSLNWAGIVDVGNGVSSVSGTFVVPTLSSTQPTYCTENPSKCSLSEWVGVDGDGNGYLLQAGIQAAWTSIGATYTPWYEVITPNNAEPEEIISGLSVNAENSVTVTLAKQQSGGWDILLKDNTTGQSFNSDGISFTDSGQNNPADFRASAASQEDAEWIAETPQYDTTQYSTQYSAMPYVSSGGNFSAISLTMSTVEQSYALTRACLGSQGTNGECLTPGSNQTAPIDYGTDYNLNPFTFNWASASPQPSDTLQRTLPTTVLGNLLP